MDTDQYKLHFHNAVERIFNNWTGLRMAVEHGMGGRNGHKTAIQIMEYAYSICLENANLSEYEVLDWLEDTIDTEFNTIFEDGSPQEISSCLLKYLRMCREGKFTEVQQELNRLPLAKSWLTPEAKITRVKDDDDSSSESSEEEKMDVDISSPTSSETAASVNNKRQEENEEEPGWTTVRNKKKR